MPFQVAYVIDPIQNIRGFFQWKNDKIEKLKGYYIYDDIGKPIKIEQVKAEKKATAKSKPNKMIYAIMAILCVCCVVLCGSLISLKKDYQERLDKQQKIVDDINAQLDEKNAVIGEQNNAINTLQSYFTDGTGKTTAEELLSKLESNEIVLENKGELISEIKSYLENESNVSFVVYTVETGDSLFSICEKMNIDYQSNFKIILSMNGIDDADKIFVGQNLLLPSVSE